MGHTGDSRQWQPANASRGPLALLLTVTIWGSSYVVTKSALSEIAPFALNVARFVIAFAILAPLAHGKGYRLRLSFQPTFLRFGLTGVALFYGLQNLGLRYTSAVNTVLVQTTIPAVTALLAVWLLKERLGRAQIAGIALSLVGTAIVALAGGGGRDAPRPLMGNALIVGTVIAWSAYTIQGKKLSVQYPALVSTTAAIGAGLAILLPLGLGELALGGLPRPSGQAGAAVLFLGVVASALPMFLWNYALDSVPASVASLYLNLIPVVGVALALLTGETISAGQLAGGLLTLVGVWVSGRAAEAQRPSGSE